MAKGRKRNDDLEIVYEDQWLIIVNKPSGLLSMSTGKQGEDTAYARVFDYAGKIFIVHRSIKGIIVKLTALQKLRSDIIIFIHIFQSDLVI